MNSQTIQSSWSKIIGEPGNTSLEGRIFHAVCFCSFILLGFTAVFNYFLGIVSLAMLMAVVFVLAGFFYYLSRFKKKLDLSIALFNLVCNGLFVVNFYYNSGINGPTLLIFLLSFVLVIAVAPKKQYLLWISLNILVVLSLLVSAYVSPGSIVNSYPDRLSHYIDLSYTYVITVLLTFLVTNAIRKNYILEKKLAERRAAELEKSNDTKDKLFSILAHDLRSPLSSIQNFLEILSEYKLEDEERLTMQKALLAETQNTQQMLSNLLLWSKEQMDGLTVNLARLNLHETLKNTLQIQYTAAVEKCVRLVNNMDQETCLMADPDMLQLVVRNLVNNAIKFTQPGGEIVLSAQNEGEMCRIMVMDNGTGIPYDQQEGIFSMKAKSTFGTKNEKGVGLGLMLCKEFTELQHGKIGFQSIPGKGTTFFITMKSCEPLEPSSSKANPLEDSHHVRG
ncbi:sensor histidine kinase [Hufsiella ginkgonis]|uniref:histidine kinase n=1 Tax=Hufsiella ginkgonis TaxID=2695274 RepID=A0A7K1Y020_9SPHI|nr:HAMP domain-containing sensor histidine kinase [Hufsiella ginkgonis]MXV16614.1 sensor histidine kinase [Hufsiella ginkgonis]